MEHNLERLNQGFDVMQRQFDFQSHEEKKITLKGYYKRPGDDYKLGKNVHFLVEYHTINDKDNLEGHIWIQNPCEKEKLIWRDLHIGSPVELDGYVYSYISKKGDKQYSLYVQNIYMNGNKLL